MRPFLPLLCFLFALPTAAQIQGIGYRLTPAVSYIDFESDAALSDGLLYGGGVGFSFGEFIELGGSYQFGSFETDLSALSGFDTPEATFGSLTVRDVDVQRYGGAIKLNLLRSFVVPYLTAGTGIVRLNPEGIDGTRSIYLMGGAGIQFTAFDRFALSFAAEDLTYRYNPGSAFFTPEDLAASGVVAEDFAQTTVHNLGVRASASVYIGGRRPGELSEIDREFQRQFSGGLSGLSLVVEPFYSRIAFDDAFAYRDQAFIGAEAGFDFGPLVGVRGFYGRGTSGANPLDFESIQMYGGDLRLRLSEGQGIVPFLSVGGGYLDVLDGYATDEGSEDINTLAEDTPFAAAGGGIGFLITPRLRAIAEVRGILMSTQDEADLSQPEDVYISPMYRAGISFGLGGKSGRRVAVVRQEELDTERDMMDAERMTLQATRDSLRAEILALETRRNVEVASSAAQRAELQRQLDDARTFGDSLAVARLEAEVRRLPVAPDSLVAVQEVMEEEIEIDAPEAEHMVTIPLPKVGELYVRYGPPGGVLIESLDTSGPSETELREAVRAALRDVLDGRDPLAPQLTEAEIAEIEERLVRRVSERRTVPVPEVTRQDLEAMEARLESRFLQALREVLAERDAQSPAPQPAPQN